MSSTDSSESSLFSNLEEWKDVTAVPSPQVSFCPFYVEMEPIYDRMMSYFRGLLNAQEYSPRAELLTRAVINSNSSNPCAFWYRRRILEHIGYDSTAELRFINSTLLDDSLKSYQLWYHRQWLADRLTERPRDLSLLRRVLIEDAKNFHAWSYSLWLADRWKMHTEVFDLTTYFLGIDARNNSAWTARAGVFAASGASADDELTFALRALSLDPSNESVCSYILFLTRTSPTLRSRALSASSASSPRLLSLRLHLLHQDNDHTSDSELYDELSRTDPQRAKFWRLLQQNSKRFD